MSSLPVTPLANSPGPYFVSVLLAAARAQQQMWTSNVILQIRRPLTPLLVFLSIYLAYKVSGQATVPEDQVVGFLVIGTLANQAWNATVWASGFALQMAAYQGTLPAILASPANRLAVVTGYGMGDMVLSAPSVLVTLVAGLLIGARFHVASIPAAVAAFVMLFVSALAVGLACAGLFILSRNANPMANFLQTPIYILAGFWFPRSVLPDWLEPVALVLPITSALEALRASMLAGAGWGDVAGKLALAVAMSAVFVVIGVWSLGRVDHELRKTGSLNLF